MDVAEVEDGVGVTGVDPWVGGTPLVDAWEGVAEGDADADEDDADEDDADEGDEEDGDADEGDTDEDDADEDDTNEDDTNEDDADEDDADEDDVGNTVVLWPATVNATTVLSFIIIRKNKSQ